MVSELVKQEVDCGGLPKNIRQAWNLRTILIPKISKFETKEMQPDINNKNNQAAVISIQNVQLQLTHTHSQTDANTDRLINYNFRSWQVATRISGISSLDSWILAGCFFRWKVDVVGQLV